MAKYLPDEEARRLWNVLAEVIKSYTELGDVYNIAADIMLLPVDFAPKEQGMINGNIPMYSGDICHGKIGG